MRLEAEEVTAIADAVAARVAGSLAERLAAITERVEQLATSALSTPVTLTEIAHELGRHVEWVRTHRWAQPDYGMPDLPGIPKTWYRTTWDTWKAQLRQHQTEWERLTPAKQLAVLEQLKAKKSGASRRLAIVREGGGAQPA